MNPAPEAPDPEPVPEFVNEHPLTAPQILHAGEEPRRTLWQRILNSRFLFISILVHLLFGIGATAYVVQTIVAKRKLTFISAPPSPNPSTRAMEHQVQMAKKQQTMSAPAMPKRIVSTGLAKVSLPEMPTMPAMNSIAAPTKMAGAGGTGMALGPGVGGMGGGSGPGGGGGGVFSLPKIMADRCSPAARAAALQANGGKPESEQAVLKALQFLKSKQNPDGSWGKSNAGAMTGFGLLCFLGHCELRSPELSPITLKAIERLVKEAEAKGGDLSFGKMADTSGVYAHGIATYALGEAFTMTKGMPVNATIEPALKAAVALIVNGQKDDGSWAYRYAKEGKPDLSVGGWQIQALKAAHYTGLDIPGVDKALDRAIDWVEKWQDPKTGTFGYNSPTGGNDYTKNRLSGVGVLALQVWKSGHSGQIIKGLQAIEKYPDMVYTSPDANLYAWYYETQACINAGGSHWQKWNKGYQDQLISNQSPDGSWPVTPSSHPWGGGASGKGGEWDIYRTSLCTLMLEVFYRYLPSSKGASGGGGTSGGSLLQGR